MRYECTYANHTSHVGILFDIAKRSKCSTMQLTALGSRKLLYKDDYVRLFSVIRKKKVVNTLINNVFLIYINTYYSKWPTGKHLILISDMINSHLVYSPTAFNFPCLKYLTTLTTTLLMYLKKEKKIIT